MRVPMLALVRRRVRRPRCSYVWKRDRKEGEETGRKGKKLERSRAELVPSDGPGKGMGEKSPSQHVCYLWGYHRLHWSYRE